MNTRILLIATLTLTLCACGTGTTSTTETDHRTPDESEVGRGPLTLGGVAEAYGANADPFLGIAQDESRMTALLEKYLRQSEKVVLPVQLVDLTGSSERGYQIHLRYRPLDGVQHPGAGLVLELECGQATAANILESPKKYLRDAAVVAEIAEVRRLDAISYRGLFQAKPGRAGNGKTGASIADLELSLWPRRALVAVGRCISYQVLP